MGNGYDAEKESRAKLLHTSVRLEGCCWPLGLSNRILGGTTPTFERSFCAAQGFMLVFGRCRTAHRALSNDEPSVSPNNSPSEN